MLKLILLGLVLFSAGAGMGVFYQQSGDVGGVGPHSPLYALDAAGEWIQLNLITWNESGRLELRVRFMQERIDELTNLARTDTLTKKYVQEIGSRYAKMADEAKEDIKKKAKETASVKTNELLRNMEHTFAKQEAALEEILRRTPSDSSGDMLKDSLVMVKSIYQQVIEKMK